MIHGALCEKYQKLRDEIADALSDYTEGMGGKIMFSPHLEFGVIKDGLYECIVTSLEYDAEEGDCMCHNYMIGDDLIRYEYYTPLMGLSFQELYKIAEKVFDW